MTCYVSGDQITAYVHRYTLLRLAALVASLRCPPLKQCVAPSDIKSHVELTGQGNVSKLEESTAIAYLDDPDRERKALLSVE
jgi:hypothetical protein